MASSSMLVAPRMRAAYSGLKVSTTKGTIIMSRKIGIINTAGTQQIESFIGSKIQGEEG